MLIAIDIGGTFLKSGIILPNTKTVSGVSRHVGPELYRGPRGEAELDAEKLMIQVRKIIHHIAHNDSRISGVLLTGQMHGWILTKPDGSPATPLVTWRDTYRRNSESRPCEPLETVSELLGEELIYKSGNELRMGIPIVSLFARVQDGLPTHGLMLNSLISFVANQLTGRFSERLIHLTDAAALGMVNVVSRDWEHEIVERLGFREISLPRVVDELRKVGMMPELNLPVYVAVGDQQASLCGTGLRENELSLNIATGSQVSRIVDSPIPHCQTRPYFRKSFLATFTHIPAGRALNVLIETVSRFTGSRGEDVWEQVIKQCDAKQLKSSVSVVPTFFPSPYGESATITGLTEETTDISNIFAGAIDWMVETYRNCANRLDQDLDLREAAVTGGLASRVGYLRRRLTSEFAGRDLRFFEEQDASLVGLAVLADEARIHND